MLDLTERDLAKHAEAPRVYLAACRVRLKRACSQIRRVCSSQCVCPAAALSSKEFDFGPTCGSRVRTRATRSAETVADYIECTKHGQGGYKHQAAARAAG
jgi:hypothetical protein